MKPSDDARAWAFYVLLAVASASLDCRLRDLHEDLVGLRHALPSPPAELRACP